MAEKDSAVLRRIWRKWYKPVLEDLFRESASINFLLTPDWAMEEMEMAFRDVFQRVESETGSAKKEDSEGHASPIFRFDEPAYTREAHRYAVDLFYKTYFPRSVEKQSRRGAPSLSLHYIDRILELRRQGLSPTAIAKKLGVPKDRMRKQVKIAEKRWRDAGREPSSTSESPDGDRLTKDR